MHLLSVAQFLGGFAVATTKKTRNGQLKSRKKKEERHCHLQAQSEWLAIVEVNVTIELWRRELGIEDLKEELAQKKRDAEELRKKKRIQKN